MVIRDRAGHETAQRCKCVEKSLVQGIINTSGLPAELKEKALSTFRVTGENRGAINKAVEFYSSWPNGKGFIITGPVGTGKTHLMAAVMNNLLHKKQIAAKFVNTPELIAALRESQFIQGEQNHLMNRLFDAPLLCFDDLGREKITDWVRDQYYRIINHRYTNRKPILATTNSSFTEISDNMGDATASRLMAMCEVVTINGRDYRMGVAADDRL